MVGHVLKTVLLAFFIVFPALKFQFFVGLTGMLIYGLLVVLLLIALQSTLGKMIVSRLGRYEYIMVMAFVLFLFLLFQILYPYLNQYEGGSNREEALNIAAHHILRGEYPYYEYAKVAWLAPDDPQNVGTPISPFPGGVLFSIPFVFLANSAWQNFFWLLVLFVFLKKVLPNEALMIWFAAFLSPIVWHEVLTGGDLLANTIWITVLSILSIHFIEARMSLKWRTLVFFIFGIGLSSRLNFLLILPAFILTLRNKLHWSQTMKYCLIIMAAFLLITLPFYLYDPNAFSPLHTYQKLARFEGVMPSTVVIALSLIASFAIIWGRKSIFTFARHAAIALLIPVLCVCFAQIYVSQEWNFMEYSWYGQAALYFALIWLWPRHYVATS
ncbi:MAG: hypothetical protein HY817_03940 [Candidatus Abawacabacteria bacterium]|nr:hypothetical protein [Candidatus Abawacabacteria bacterium]